MGELRSENPERRTSRSRRGLPARLERVVVAVERLVRIDADIGPFDRIHRSELVATTLRRSVRPPAAPRRGRRSNGSCREIEARGQVSRSATRCRRRRRDRRRACPRRGEPGDGSGPCPRKLRGASAGAEESEAGRRSVDFHLASRSYSLRNATSSMRWLAPLVSSRSARGRVGRMFSCRLTRLMRRQIERAVASASASSRSAYWRK